MMMAVKPLSIHVLSQRMGYTAIKTTEIYLQVVDEEKRKMVVEAWKGKVIILTIIVALFSNGHYYNHNKHPKELTSCKQ